VNDVSSDKPWIDHFDFYLTQFNDKLAGVLVDLGAGPHAPLATHPTRVRLTVSMQQPLPNGLRSDGESERLFALEDVLVSALEQALGAIYVGRVVIAGLTDLAFYAPSATIAAVEQQVAPLRAGYAIEVEVLEDRQWAFYHEVLAPDPYAFQQIMTRRVMQELAERGDDPALPRTVDHFAYLPTAEAASAAAAALREAGFAVEEPKSTDQGNFALTFHDETALADQRIDRRIDQILDILLPLEGDYDGWGCPVTGPN
jgi:regulator of RNase E activity RraB